MKKQFLIVVYTFVVIGSSAQTITQKIEKAYQQFEADSQMRHAISSLYVINAKTGEVVFDKNSQIGLAPASTQKIITAATALELLGKDYKYKTELGYSGKIDKYGLDGNLYIFGNGDPTLGSWRFIITKEEKVFLEFAEALKKKGIKKISGVIETHAPEWGTQFLPDGWIWQDIGNYYGAGAGGVNWRENQFDVILESGDKINGPVYIKNIIPELYGTKFISEIKSAAKNTGDNGYIYLPINSREGYLRGTIPIGEKEFKISGAIPDPPKELAYLFAKYLSIQNPGMTYLIESMPDFGNAEISKTDNVKKTNVFYTHYSPSLDSIIYWFLQKSINLYGEALIKTFAYEKKGFGSTDSGVVIVKDFWKQKGIDEDELNISDGSGLSPQNRVTTHAQVEVLKYAKTKDWFPYFYNALPVYNGMKMKSGSIKDVKGYCGYQKAKDGNEYIFSFLVNNYNGSSSGVVSKMYKVLDVLEK
jgi:D-alanyl-D-alanine carboxypeptidase/D-alanyl-D-alanine-endopeptidase (penicillin-binding protein 4)